MNVELRQIRDEDIEELLENMLLADRAEVLALGHDLEWAVRNSVATSIESVAIRKNGRLGSLLGVARPLDLDETVAPWLLSTTFMLDNPKEVLRLSRVIFDRWSRTYPHMVNYVDVRHERAIRWLGWLGADFEYIDQHGPYKRPFYRFSFGEPQCA